MDALVHAFGLSAERSQLDFQVDVFASEENIFSIELVDSQLFDLVDLLTNCLMVDGPLALVLDLGLDLGFAI